MLVFKQLETVWAERLQEGTVLAYTTCLRWTSGARCWLHLGRYRTTSAVLSKLIRQKFYDHLGWLCKFQPVLLIRIRKDLLNFAGFFVSDPHLSGK